jgi:outer membrane protein assembly factor BamB
MVALDVLTGQTVWEFAPDLQGWGRDSTSPVVAGNMVFFGMGELVKLGLYPERDIIVSHMFGVDAKTGKEKWRFQTEEQTVTTPVVLGDMVYFGSGQTGSGAPYTGKPFGYLYALKAASGEMQWKLPLVEADILETPVADKELGVIYFVERLISRNRTGYLFAVDAKTGKERWRFPTDTNLYYAFGPRIARGTVYFVNDNYGDDRVYAVNARGGRRKWDFTVRLDKSLANNPDSSAVNLYSLNASRVITSVYIPRAGINSLPVMDEDTAYLAVNVDTGIESDYGNVIDYYLIALDVTTGQEKWRYKSEAEITSELALAGNSVLFSSAFTHYLYAVNSEIGQLEWKFEADDSVVGTPSVAGGLIYFGDYAGNFYAIEPLQIGMPKSGLANRHLIVLTIASWAVLSLGFGSVLAWKRRARRSNVVHP